MVVGNYHKCVSSLMHYHKTSHTTLFLNREGRLGDSARLGQPCTLKSAVRAGGVELRLEISQPEHK